MISQADSFWFGVQ